MSAERINQLLVLLPDSELPDDVVWWLVAGLEGWQRGQSLEDALGLHDGYEYLGIDERDELLRAAIQLCPGISASAKASYFLEILSGRLKHPDPSGRNFTDILLKSRTYIPRSIRHLRSRILQGKRHDSWRQWERDDKALCPSSPISEDGSIFKPTGTD